MPLSDPYEKLRTVHADNSPPPKASTHAEFDALPQDEKIKWLVTQFRLDAAPVLQRDPRLRKEVIRTLLQFSDVISIGGYGKTNLISHPINVYPGTTPIKMKHRPLNPVIKESLRQQIDRWLEQQVVEEADSPWSFPLVPVPKKNSKEVRWAVDYRRLNAITKKDAFPLPNIADNLSRLAGSRVFSTLDGAGAFHAIPVGHADREKTAFSSPFGQYQLVRMPFGLANALANYSRLIAKALHHLPSSEVLCYLDDTAVHSQDAWSHLRVICIVLAAFCRRSPDLTREGPVVPGSHQVSGTRDQCSRDQYSPGIHLCHQRLADPRHSEDAKGLHG